MGKMNLTSFHVVYVSLGCRIRLNCVPKYVNFACLILWYFFFHKINEKSFSITITKFFMKNVQCSLIFD